MAPTIRLATQKVAPFLDTVRKEVPISAVYLFGSHAKGTARKDSDIDIAIISSSFGKDRFAENVRLQKHLWKSPFKNIDVVGYSPKDFEDQDSPLVAEILKSGVRIE